MPQSTSDAGGIADRYAQGARMGAMMKKKIMLLSPMLHQGGFERVCVATARLLEPYFDVYIVIFSSRDIAYDIHGLHVIDLRLGSVDSLPGKIRNVILRSRKVSRLKKELGIDIAYSFGPTANLVNVCSRSHGLTWCGVRSYMDMGNPRSLKLFCKRADKIICCSRIIEKELQEQYGCRKTDTLYNPFDAGELRRSALKPEDRLPFTNHERVIVSMGRQDDVKGYWHLVKSFSLVNRRLPDTRLLIVGEGDFHEYWKLAESLGVADAIRFPGVKRNPFPWMNLGSVYVMTSLNEGFPNVLAEAMCLGKPVISTNCMTGPAEILMDDFVSVEGREAYIDGDYGILIPNLSREKNMQPEILPEEERLAEQIIRMLEDKALYQHYREASLKRAADFSNEAYVEAIRRMAEEPVVSFQ